jgi:Fe-S-cluster containining protein
MKCSQCARCCKETTVCLNNEDIERISKKYSSFFIVRKTGVKIMKWKQNKEKYICIFLNPENETCEIYEDRPKVCKEYYCNT